MTLSIITAVTVMAFTLALQAWLHARRLDDEALKLRKRVRAMELQAEIDHAALASARQELETLSDAFAALVQGRLRLVTAEGIVRLA